MKLSYKLFLSYLFVVAIALVVLAAATAYLAPANFSEQMSHMRGGMSNSVGQHMADFDAEIETTFQSAIRNALFIAGVVAILASLGISWFVSQRIISPIRSIVALSQRIAGGHYEQRLQLNTGDELAELVENFNRMTESLASTETMRIRLLGDVTHELKTPLASIKGYMEALQDGVLTATPDTFQLIHREADRLERLVQDLQQLSRAEAGQIPLNIQTYSPHKLVMSAIERMRIQFAEKGITLQVDTPELLPPVRADPDRTSQILTNLLGNALQYTHTGGTVQVTASRDNSYVRFSIMDSGIGLKEEDLHLIFQRFYRVDKSRSRASGGSGIGLTIAKHLVEAQGGEIRVTSQGIGKGSQFSFILPIV